MTVYIILYNAEKNLVELLLYESSKVIANIEIDFSALLHFRTPPFLLMILVQNFMLIKNHIETWV